MIHEFVCADCKANVITFVVPGQALCASCSWVREVNERDPMTLEQEAALREIIDCVIPVAKAAK